MVENEMDGSIHSKENNGIIDFMEPFQMRRVNTMVYGKKVIIYFVLIIIIMSFCITCSYSQGKPSDKEILDIIIIMERGNSLPEKYMKNIKVNTFVITNNFFSKINGRYCVEVNLDVSYQGRKHTLDDWRFLNDQLINKRYSFVKKHNQWYGYIGWGPGED